MNINKNWNNFMIYVIAPIVTIALLGVSNVHFSNKICEEVAISIEYKGDNFFLDRESIRELIGADYQILGAKVGDIQLSHIEKILEQTNYIVKANAYFKDEHCLNIQIWLNNPIARVINDKGEGFYIDDELKKIPVSDLFTARTMLIRGSFNEQYIEPNDTIQDTLLKRTLPFIQHVTQDEFWGSIISEVKIEKSQNISLYLQATDLMIEFGTLKDYPTKLIALKTFFQTVMPKKGWNYYKKLVLKYDGQIVGVRS